MLRKCLKNTIVIFYKNTPCDATDIIIAAMSDLSANLMNRRGATDSAANWVKYRAVTLALCTARLPMGRGLVNEKHIHFDELADFVALKLTG